MPILYIKCDSCDTYFPDNRSYVTVSVSPVHSEESRYYNRAKRGEYTFCEKCGKAQADHLEHVRTVRVGEIKG